MLYTCKAHFINGNAEHDSEAGINSTGRKIDMDYINSQDDNYPEIKGITPEKDGEKDFLYMGHHLYKNLDMLIDYTGKIIVGKGFINKYYIHMGYQRAWAYEVLQELIFDKGVFV